MKTEVEQVKKFYRLILPKFWKRGLILFILLFFSAIILLPFPFLIKYLVDNIIPNKNINGLIMLSCFLLCLYGFESVYQYFLAKFRINLNNDIIIHLRTLISIKLEKIKDFFFRKTDQGTIFHRYVDDIEESQGVLFESFASAFISVVQILFGIIAMLFLNVKMTILVLIVLPFYLVSYYHLGGKVTEEQRKLTKKRSLLYGCLFEFIKSIHLIKSYVIDKYENNKLNKKMQDYADEVSNFVKLRTIISEITSFISSLGPLIILIYGGYNIIQGDFTLGALMAFLSFIDYVFGPSASLINFGIQLKKTIPNIDNLLNLLNFEEEPRRRIKYKKINNAKIKFNNVSYSIDKIVILKNINFLIKNKQMVSFIGRSGAGKSSIINLIEGFWYPDKGNVLINDKNTKEIDTRTLRRNIGYIAQKPIMLKTTIYENIKLGKKISLSKVKKIAKRVNIHNFIKLLPKGYHTIIDPDETNLSGGQLQRIALARALVHKNKFLLLDEFSSAIDPETEHKILKSINKLKGEKTIIIVAHHKICVKNSDNIFVMENGKIVEQGSYKQLSSIKTSKFNEIFNE